MEHKFNLKLHIKNYKQIGTEVPFEADLQGDVLLITGNNRAGKTGLVNALSDAWALKSNTPIPLTFGKDEGYKKITIPTLDGDSVTIVHNFSADNPAGIFYGIKSDGKVINSIPTLRKLIGDYAPMSVEQFFSDMKYSESRKKLVKNYLIPLMGDSSMEIELINKKVNENGTLYKQRTEINNAIKFLKSQEVITLTDMEKTFLEKEERIFTALEDLKKQKVELNAKILTFDSEKELYEDVYNTLIGQSKKLKKESDAKLVLLLDQATNEAQSLFLEFSPEVKKMLDDSMVVLDENIAKGTNAVAMINAAKTKQATINERAIKLQAEETKKTELEEEMDELKAKRSKLIKAANIPSGIDTDGENITLNGFDFVAEQVSYSDAALAIAEIMAQLFTGKIITLGNVTEFGPQNRKRIFEIAEKYDKLVVVTQVTDETEVKVQAIVE